MIGFFKKIRNKKENQEQKENKVYFLNDFISYLGSSTDEYYNVIITTPNMKTVIDKKRKGIYLKVTNKYIPYTIREYFPEDIAERRYETDFQPGDEEIQFINNDKRDSIYIGDFRPDAPTLSIVIYDRDVGTNGRNSGYLYFKGKKYFMQSLDYTILDYFLSHDYFQYDPSTDFSQKIYFMLANIAGYNSVVYKGVNVLFMPEDRGVLNFAFKLLDIFDKFGLTKYIDTFDFSGLFDLLMSYPRNHFTSVPPVKFYFEAFMKTFIDFHSKWNRELFFRDVYRFDVKEELLTKFFIYTHELIKAGRIGNETLWGDVSYDR